MTARRADLEPLAFLLGTWNGDGLAEYPTMQPLACGEEMTFEHVGEPWLAYFQRSWSLTDGTPLSTDRTPMWRHLAAELRRNA